MEPRIVAVQRTVYFSGHVQGVGFRYTARRVARGFDVTGFVRNLPDGRVHIVAEGEIDELDQFIEAIKSQMQGMIRGLQSNDAPATGRFISFDITF
ncbi:MAG: acylphosphatase [Phycisphaerae bacterium]|nr:acylphosphatase [Phycisphaerae bacterium]